MVMIRRRKRRRLGTWADVPTAPALLAVGALLTVIGDGVGSEAAAAGLRNYPALSLMSLSGRLLPSEGYNLCRSGDTLALEYDRVPYAVGTTPDVLARVSAGHNDGLLSTDPASPAGIALMADWVRTNQYILDNAHVRTKRIILSTTIGSLVGNPAPATGEFAYAAAVNAAQKAWINAKVASDPRVVLWDCWALYNHNNCNALAPASDAQRVHPDNRGGWKLAFGDGVNPGFAQILDSVVAPATIPEMQAWLDANTANLDGDILLSGGTTGNKTGATPPTGVWPTGKAIANGTNAPLACSIIDQPGFKRARAVASGTPTATGTVVMNDTANIALTGSTPGQLFAGMMRVMLDDGAGGAAKGLVNFSFSLGAIATIGNSTDQSAVITGDFQAPIDWLIVAQPLPVYGTNGPATANPGLTLRERGGTVQDWEAAIEKPRAARLYSVARSAPVPLWKVAGVFVANAMMRLTTAPFANGQTIRVDPGLWAGGGLDNAAFVERRIYEVTAADQSAGLGPNQGHGTLKVALSGANWTWVAAGLTPASGRVLYLEITVTTAGGTRTERVGPYVVT